MALSEQEPLSVSEKDLYLVLGVEKGCTQEDIRRSYRKLALKYHPDKNPEEPAITDTFREVNHAYSVLSDSKTRNIYDQYGSLGLYVAEQLGEQHLATCSLLSSWWAKGLFILCGLLTGCYCCCCLCCCFNGCCGRCKERDAADGDSELYVFSKDLEEPLLADPGACQRGQPRAGAAATPGAT